jgi:hypothetical protein
MHFDGMAGGLEVEYFRHPGQQHATEPEETGPGQLIIAASSLLMALYKRNLALVFFPTIRQHFGLAPRAFSNRKCSYTQE